MIERLLDGVQSTDPNHRLMAIEQVRGTDACDELIMLLVRALADDNTEICEAAAKALAVIGRPAIAYLIGVLRNVPDDISEEFPARWYAAAAIGGMGEEAHVAVPNLIELMHDPDWRLPRVAALALGGIGSRAIVALPALLDASHDSEDPTLRSFAREAIQKIIGSVG